MKQLSECGYASEQQTVDVPISSEKNYEFYRNRKLVGQRLSSRIRSGF